MVIRGTILYFLVKAQLVEMEVVRNLINLAQIKASSGHPRAQLII